MRRFGQWGKRLCGKIGKGWGNDMKEKWEKLTAVWAEKEYVSKLNMMLALLVALFSGVIIGFLTCPKRKIIKYTGCFNGCHNGNANTNSGNAGAEDISGADECGLRGEKDSEEERCCGETEYCGNDACCCEEENDSEGE